MIWFLIGFICTVVYIIKEREYFSLVDYPIVFLIGMFTTTLTWVTANFMVTAILLGGDLTQEVLPRGVEWKTVSEYKLEAINDKEYVETVIVDEEMYHKIIVKQNGANTTVLCDIKNTIIQEGDKISVETQSPKFESDILEVIFFIPVTSDRYVITVPSN